MLYPVELRALNRGRYCTLSSWLCALNRPSIRLSSRFIAVSTIAALLIMLSIGSPVAIQAGIHAGHYQGQIAIGTLQSGPQATALHIQRRPGVELVDPGSFAIDGFLGWSSHSQSDPPVALASSPAA